MKLEAALSLAPATAIALASGASVPLRRALRGPQRPGWSIGTETTARVVRSTMLASRWLGLGWLRAVQESGLVRSHFLDEVELEDVDAAGVRARWCRPRRRPAPGAERSLVYLHGGAYVMGSPRSHAEAIARLAVGVGADVLGVDYRLSPEHPFPAAQNDCLTATRWVLDQADAPEHVALAGDSAGGALCIATLVGLRDAGAPLPAGAFVISPWVDPLAEGGSMLENADCDILTPELLAGWTALHASGPALQDPRLRLVDAKLDGLPPLLVQLAGDELLADQVRLFAERAREAGVEVEVEDCAGQVHDFQMLAARLAEGARAMEAAVRWLRERLGVADEPA